MPNSSKWPFSSHLPITTVVSPFNLNTNCKFSKWLYHSWNWVESLYSFLFYTFVSHAILLWKWYTRGAQVEGQKVQRRSLALWWDYRLWMQITN
jgi:hypothetical protein